jgi:hypothetical protein
MSARYSQKLQQPQQQGTSVLPYLVCFVLVIAVGVYWFIDKRDKAYKPVTETVPTISRDQFTPPATPLTVQQFWTDDMIRKVELGQGLEFTFEKSYNGKVLSEDCKKVLKFKAFSRPEEEDGPVRRAAMDKFKEELASAIKWYNEYQPVTWNIEVYLDDTSGVSEPLKKQVFEKVKDLKIGDLIKRGDSINLYTYKVSSDEFMKSYKIQIDSILVQPDGKPKVVDVPAYLKEADQKIDGLLDGLTKSQTTKPASSIATSFFNSAAENTGKNYRILLVFSDGVEHRPGITADFYSQDRQILKDQSKWSDLDTRMTKLKPFPNLENCLVYWYAPPSGDSELFLDSQKYWQYVLEKNCKAAKVNMKI